MTRGLIRRDPGELPAEVTGCAKAAEPVLRYAPQVTILATSRQPMNVPGEHCCPVPPLPVPDP